MERLEKIVNILKLTPHYQPDLVKEATHLILSRAVRSDAQILKRAKGQLRPLIEILIRYCDNNDSAQRSLFNDYLNSVILNFQHTDYQLIFNVLTDQVTNNGSTRTVTVALQRIPYLIQNVRPINLGCEPSHFLKGLIEISRRSDDESILGALDSTLKQVMPYLECDTRRNRDMQILSNSLIEILLRNLQHESSQTKRLAASSLAIISSNSENLLQSIMNKLSKQLELIETSDNSQLVIGFFLCAKSIPEYTNRNCNSLIKLILNQMEKNEDNTILITGAFELLKDLFKYGPDNSLIDLCAKMLVEKFLIEEANGEQVARKGKIILQANALACLSSIVRHRPTILDQYESILAFKYHDDTTVHNHLVILIGDYIDALLRFPNNADRSVDREKIRKLWSMLRDILTNYTLNVDTLKSCVTAMRNCLGNLLESDHGIHVVYYEDFEEIIRLYERSDFKPLKIEALNLFANLNYRTLYYLERYHWSKIRSQSACSVFDSLQKRIMKVIVKSLTDPHPMIRQVASRTLVTIVPNLFVIELHDNTFIYRSTEPVVSLAQDLADDHLSQLRQAEEYICHIDSDDKPSAQNVVHEKSCIKNNHRSLSSCIIQSVDNPFIEKITPSSNLNIGQQRVDICINLKYVIGLLKKSAQKNLSKGKTAMSSIVNTLYELSLEFPIHDYAESWDCKPYEDCSCFTILNYLLSYMENLTEPNVVIDDLDAYKNFLNLTHELLFAICHECLLNSYENQKIKPFHKRQAETREGDWSEVSLKHPRIASCLDVYFNHITKLLSLLSYIIDEQANPFVHQSKQPQVPEFQDEVYQKHGFDFNLSHRVLVSNDFLFGRAYKKFESSYRSSRKNLNQRSQKFFQILEACLTIMSSLLEFINMKKAVEKSKDILNYLKITFATCGVLSLKCARQFLKSLFGINLIAIYQADPVDWFDDNFWSAAPGNHIGRQSISNDDNQAQQSVYHHLIANPHKIFSTYLKRYSRLAMTVDKNKSMSVLNFKTRRALAVRRRIEDRVKTLFETNYLELPPRVKQISDLLKSIITQFTPIVKLSMDQFDEGGFCNFQSEVVHFMSYLVLLRVNFHKLEHSEKLIQSVNKLIDDCGEKTYKARGVDIALFLQQSFTFLTLLTYERGPSKPLFDVKKLDDIKARLAPRNEGDTSANNYITLAEVAQPNQFVFETLLGSSKIPDISEDSFNQWMSSVGIAIHVLMTRVAKPEFLSKLQETMTVQSFIEYLLHITQLCIAEILLQLQSQDTRSSDIKFLTQQLASYILHLTHMFQYELFFILPEKPIACIRQQNKSSNQENLGFKQVCEWARDPRNGFCIDVCEKMFFYARIVLPDITILWCNLIVLLNHVECNQSYWQKLLTYDGNSANLDQCLPLNLELTRRGVLCVLLDFLTLSMSDVEFVTWLTIHHINDIIRWAHEGPISEFISAVHRNSASSGIFIQAISISSANLDSIAYVTRLKCTLRKVHYTQYGSLIVLLVQKLLCSPQLMPLRSITKQIEEFACETVENLLVHKNKCLVTTNEDVLNQLGAEDLSRIYSMLDHELYPKISQMLLKLRESIQDQSDTVLIESHVSVSDSDEDSEDDDVIERLYSKASSIHWLVKRGLTGDIVTLIQALNTIWDSLNDCSTVQLISNETPLVCNIISAIYSLVLSILPPPTRITRPKFWVKQDLAKGDTPTTNELGCVAKPPVRPSLLGLGRSDVKAHDINEKPLLSKNEDQSSEMFIESVRNACLKGLFLVENVDLLPATQYECLRGVVILLARLPLINSFVLTPSSLWRQGLWPIDISPQDIFKIQFPIVNHEILLKDLSLVDDFCDRLLKLGWTSRRQFEEAWMTLLGVLSATLSYPTNQSKPNNNTADSHDTDRKTNLITSCRLIISITKFLLYSNKSIPGNPLSPNTIRSQSFDSRLVELTRSISNNLSSLRRRTQPILDMIELEKKLESNSHQVVAAGCKMISSATNDDSFNQHLRVSADKLRFNAIEMQDTVVIHVGSQRDEPDVESCIKLLLSIYRQKINNPNESLIEPACNSMAPNESKTSKLSNDSTTLQADQHVSSKSSKSKEIRQSQMPPPLATAICQSILALSDLFNEIEQFDWLFETFVDMFKLAERNEDEIQMQYLIIGLCKSVAICCYDLPSEQVTSTSISHRDIMFEKCRQSVEKCMKSNLSSLKMHALSGVFYMLEDSVNIVASGAYELDHFKQFRQSRSTWLNNLAPLILDRENSRLLTTKPQTIKLLESLCECVQGIQLKTARI